ncbi:MAG: choice-of-anchor D domain-containing protein, partial [Acidimicrobiales bacterium]
TVKLVTSEPDGGTLTCALDSAPMADCGVWVDYVGLSDGPHVISARAYDAAGNPSALAKVSWTIDTVAPTATINTGPPALSNDATPTFSFSSTEPGSTFSCSKDLGAFVSCTSPKTYTWMSNGAHTLDVRAKDAAGNYSATTRWSWTIDAAKPTVSISVPSNASMTSIPTFTITVSESGTVLRCSLDAATATVCGTTVSYAGIALGSHKLAVYATDAAGNVGKTVTVSWKRVS